MKATEKAKEDKYGPHLYSILFMARSTDKWIIEWKDRWTNGTTDGLMEGQTRHTHESTVGLMHGKTNGPKGPRTSRWTE